MAREVTRRKKPYTPPRLVRYGDVKRLTRTDVAKGGDKKDGIGPDAPRSKL